MRIAVLGAGAWGIALAMQLVRAGRTVSLWAHKDSVAQSLQQTRCTPLLANIRLPDAIEVTSDLSQALKGAQGLLIAVPSHAFTQLLQQLAQLPVGCLPPYVAWATKGFDQDSHELLHQQVHHYLPQVSGTVLSGPTFAHEVALGLPTAIVAASDQVSISDWWAKRLHHAHFRVYTNTDVTGVEIGGAVKNVMAIAAGVSDGLGFGANARAALVARALAEMMRLGQVLGAQPDTLMGLTGLGDLVLTCTDDQSRNRRFGMALAQGQSLAQAEQALGTVEGLLAVRSVMVLAERYGLELPIAHSVYQVVSGQLSPKAAVAQLLAREAGEE